MEATAKVSLDATGYEAGADKVSRADRAMAGSAKENFSAMGDSARRAFDGVSTSAEKGVRSYRDLKEAARDAGRTIEAENKRISESARRAGQSGSEPRPGMGEHGVYSSRVRQQVGMHVATSVMDQTLAGQSPLRALEMEGPRIAEMLGVGMGATIGIAAAAAAVGALAKSYHDARVAEREFSEQTSFVNGRGTTAGQYEEEIKKVVAARDTLREKSGGFLPTMAETLANVPRMAFGFDPTKGDKTPEEQQRDKIEAGASAQLIALQGQKVGALKEEVDLRVRASAEGEHAVKVAQIELRTRQEIQAAHAAASLIPELSADAEVKQIERRANVEKAAAAAEDEIYRSRITLRKNLAEIRNPGITKGSLGFDPEDLEKFGNVKTVAAARADFSQSLAELQTLKDKHLDTTDASADVTAKQAALADALRSEKESYNTVSATANIEEMRLNYQTTAATNASTLLGLENRITAATDAGRTAEANRLGALKNSIVAAQKLDAFLHPQKYAQERAEGRAHDRAQEASDRVGGLLGVTRGAGGEVIGGYDPATGKNRLSAPDGRRMTPLSERIAASDKERYRQEHVHNGENAAKPNVNDLLNFENHFGPGKVGGRDWMQKDFAGMGYKDTSSGQGYGRVPLNDEDFKAAQPDTRDEDFNATAREGRSGMIDKVNFNQDARATREKMIEGVTPKLSDGVPKEKADFDATAQKARGEMIDRVTRKPYDGSTKAKEAAGTALISTRASQRKTVLRCQGKPNRMELPQTPASSRLWRPSTSLPASSGWREP